jgi:succinoglycan biosynthesis protein ExoA
MLDQTTRVEAVSNSGPAVSIVVPCRNEADHIESTLQSILTQEPPPGGFEVIVADGMSEDGTREILARLAAENPRVQMIDNPKRIIAAGLNLAIAVAKGRIIIRMDAHTQYASDYIRQCLAILDETGADNVGGPWIAEGKGFVGRTIAAAFRSMFAVGGGLAHQPAYEGVLDTVYLGCWPVEVFERIEFFDEEFVRSEDDEFNLRLTRAGGKIWQSPRIRSCYRTRESLRSLFRQQMQDGYWKVRVLRKHKIPASVRHLVPAMFVFMLIALPLASVWSALAAWSWLLLIGTYLTCNLAASVTAAARSDWKLLPLFPVVFACYHIAYGYGFLRGLFDFMIIRGAPSAAYTELTRTSAGNLSTTQSANQ